MNNIRLPSHPDITAEQARDIRAHAWSYVFDCYAKKNAAGVSSTNGDDEKEGSRDYSLARQKYTR
jgi:hypothetical protein